MSCILLVRFADVWWFATRKLLHCSLEPGLSSVTQTMPSRVSAQLPDERKWAWVGPEESETLQKPDFLLQQRTRKLEFPYGWKKTMTVSGNSCVCSSPYWYHFHILPNGLSWPTFIKYIFMITAGIHSTHRPPPPQKRNISCFKFRSEDNFWESLLSCYHVGRTQIVRPGGRCLTGPISK